MVQHMPHTLEINCFMHIPKQKPTCSFSITSNHSTCLLVLHFKKNELVPITIYFSCCFMLVQNMQQTLEIVDYQYFKQINGFFLFLPLAQNKSTCFSTFISKHGISANYTLLFRVLYDGPNYAKYV